MTSRCGGDHPGQSDPTPELAHAGPGGLRTLGVRCCVRRGSSSGCALFPLRAVLAAVQPETAERLQRALFELERDAARAEAERAAAEEREREVSARLAQQAVRFCVGTFHVISPCVNV